jgi:scyllo-inositol 2-dehydrogenase (NADP+)
MKPINIAIVGLGRAGWDIHALALEKLPEHFKIAAVVDRDAGRRAEACQRFGCGETDHFDNVLADKDIELVVIATPNLLHAPQTIAALRAGKHVVCDKPMATSLAEADAMIRAAEESGRALSIFHNMRYWPDFMKIREVIDSGILGRIVQIRLAWQRFGRRWDWQTLREFGGGMLNNSGAHLLDLALQLFGPADPQVTAILDRTLASGDAEDHVKVILRAPGSPTIDVEVSHTDPYPQDRWHIMGTSGGLRGTNDQLEWKWVDWSTMPPRPVDRSPSAAGRSWNREELSWQSASWKKDEPYGADYARYYRDMFEVVRKGKPVVVTPESVRRVIALLDKCRSLS